MKIVIDKFENFCKMPNRAHHNDSGMDVFATEDYTIPPRSVYAAPLGFGLQLPDGYDAVIHCKSGLSSRGIFCMNSPVDAGYRSTPEEKAEIHAIMFNSTDKPFEVTRGMKVGQIVVRPVIYIDLVDPNDEAMLNTRGGDAFGSTGK